MAFHLNYLLKKNNAKPFRKTYKNVENFEKYFKTSSGGILCQQDKHVRLSHTNAFLTLNVWHAG